MISGGKVMFNDLLGSTVGIHSESGYKPVSMTAFGETPDADAFFTGKPQIGELGYAFLFRNYRADHGKWNSADPLGYPDGWNNLAYVNNWATNCIDILGTDIYHVAYTGNIVGHSSSIIGNPTNGYKAYNFGGDGGGYNTGSISENVFTTPAEALADLNRGRAAGAEYDSVQKWDTTPAQDKKAQDANKKHIDDGKYGSYANNCTDAVEAALGAAGVNYSPGFKPSTFFNNNKNKAETLNYNDFKKGLVE